MFAAAVGFSQGIGNRVQRPQRALTTVGMSSKHGLLLSSTCLLDPKIPEMKGVGCWRSPYSVTFLSKSSIHQGEQPSDTCMESSWGSRSLE